MNSGVLYYNYGLGCLPRLVVSLYSMRKHYSGPIVVLSDGEQSHQACKEISKESRLEVEVRECDFEVRHGRNHHYLSKCRLHEYTPFDTTVYVDSDTLIRGDISDLAPIAAKNEFVVTQFSNWVTTGRTITKRINDWAKIRPNDMVKALQYGPAVNTGVMAFQKNAKFMLDWFRIARKGRKLFIPDETSCQVVLWRYPHKVVEWWYNASCRYDDVSDPKVRVIHYHGRKHCRAGLPHNAKLWWDTYKEIVDKNVAGIQLWTPATDKHLAKYLAGL